MTYTLLPAQCEFLHIDDPSVQLDIVCYQGGFGSGKSFIGSFLGLELARKYQGSTGLVGALTLPMIKRTTLESYYEHLDVLGLIEGVDYTYHRSDNIMTFHCWGGSKIIFTHLEDSRKLKSLNLAWAHLEEGSELEESVFLMVISRLRQSGVGRYRLFVTTNPQASKGWIHEYFIEKQGSCELDGVKIQYRRVIAPSTENINLSPMYLESMRGAYDEEYYKINVLGQDGDYRKGLVCYNWSALANVEPTPYRKDMRIYLSVDFNVDPMSWVLAHRFNDEYHFFDEIVLENTNINQTVEEFATRYNGHEAGLIVTGDATGQSRNVASEKPNETYYKIMMNELTRHGFTAAALDLKSANPLVERRTEAWNALVCNMAGVRRIKVDPRCKWLIWNCENLKYIQGSSVIYEPTANDIKRDNKLKFTKHVWDAASYLVDRYDPIRNEVAHRRKQKIGDIRHQPQR